MFEDLIRERGLKKDCPYCNSTAVIPYGLHTIRKNYGKGPVHAHTQSSYCIKCGKKWFIQYDAKMNIVKIDDGKVQYV